ncbi:MAG: hypothetical protein AB1641_15230 [Thermodesulfobacteriota bacterium]
MVLNLTLTLAGLAAVGYGLTGRTALSAALAAVGWLAFLTGVVELLVPGFF